MVPMVFLVVILAEPTKQNNKTKHMTDTKHTKHKTAAGGVGWGGWYSYFARLGYLTIDHASLSRRSTVPTPNRDASNIWALITSSIHYIETVCLSYPRPVSPSAATMYLLG